jgi:polygalacturonase
VAITNSTITNGDDCVSLKPNSTNILIQNLTCRNSHGISIGSLGQYAGTQDIIANALIKNITMINASNGARIKAFGGNSSPTSTKGGGNGYVRNITFEGFKCVECELPVVIDMCYETSTSTCEAYPSKVNISGVHFVDVTGTGTKRVVVRLECSGVCEDITSTGTNLAGGGGSAEYLCKNVGNLGSLDFPCQVEGSGSGITSSTTKAARRA